MNLFTKCAAIALGAFATVVGVHAQVLRVDLTSPANEASIAHSPGGIQARAFATLRQVGGIQSIAVAAPGAGYTAAALPLVTISGVGTGAAATVTLNATGGIESINVTSPGTGYDNTTTVTLSGGTPTTPATVGAVALTPTVGTIAAINLTSNGGGYTTTPNVTITGGGGSGATATATVSNGVITAVTVNTPGSGYVEAPIITIDPPPGVVVITARVTGTDAGYITQFFVNNSPVSVQLGGATPTASWTAPQPGSYFITARTTDTLGNTALSLPVRIFVTGASVLSPLAGTLVPLGSSVVISGDATLAQGFIKQVEFFVNGSSQGVDETAPYSMPYRPLSPGSYSITVVGTDNNNNKLTSSPTLIQVVNPIGAPPTTRIINPIDNSSVAAGTTVNIISDSADPDGFINKVEFYLNGVLLNTDTSFPFTTSWTPAVPGRFHLVALGFDDKGNVGASTPTVINVTGGFPTVALTSPAAGGTNVIQGTRVAVSVAAAGADGGISSLRSIEFLVDGNVNDALPKNPGGLVPPPPLTQPFVFTWQSNVALGAHRLSARVTDNNGLTITSADVPVTVIANQLPSISITSPSAGASIAANTATPIIATASDVDGNVESVEFFVNGLNLGAPVTTSPFQVSWTPDAPGPYVLTAKVTDDAGATVPSAAVAVTVEVATSTTGSGGSNTVYRGDYASTTETGSFAFGVNRNNRATFIGFSKSPTGRTYLWTDIPVNPDGTFTVRGSDGATVLTGQTSPTGVSGRFGDRTFIGALTLGSSTFTPLLLAGSLESSPNSEVNAIVGGDGSITLYVASGAAREAGSGFLSGTGSFSFATPTGGSFSGNATPSLGLVSGSASGAVPGTFLVRQQAGRLVNLSARTLAGGGDRTLVAGFVVRGTGTKPLLIRAVGPTLANFGVNNPLADPSLAIVSATGATLASNNDWGNVPALANASTQLGAFPLSANGRDAALQVSLAPGSYSAVVGGAGTTSGNALIEIYDANSGAPGTARISNISTRGLVSGSDALLAGFVIAGDQKKTLLIRAVGPSLALFGVTGTLEDPKLDVFVGSTKVTGNDDWTGVATVTDVNTTTPLVGAFPLLAGSKDAAIVTRLNPGAYTVQVTGAGTSSGVVLIEIYDVDP